MLYLASVPSQRVLSVREKQYAHSSGTASQCNQLRGEFCKKKLGTIMVETNNPGF